jgi:hypothetical protein
LIFGDGELTARPCNVRPILVQVVSETESVTYSPAFALQQIALVLIATAAAQSQLKRALDMLRNLNEFIEFEMLAPPIDIAVELHFTPWLPPVTDSRKHAGLLNGVIPPEVDNDRLSSWFEFESIRRRYEAIRLSDLFTESEKRTMWLEMRNSRLFFRMKVDLYSYGIGFQIDQPVGR